MTQQVAQITDSTGLATEVPIGLETYKEAYTKGLSLPQFLSQKIGMDAATEEKYGTPFEQAMAQAGIYLNHDRRTGISPPKLSSILNGDTQINMGSIVRPDGSQALTVSGRLLFPAVIEAMVEDQLYADTGSYEAMFNSMTAMTSSSDSPRIDQPIINLQAPRAYRSQPISQMAEPASMATITLSEATRRIPTFSIGLELSDESAQATALDLVSITLREQARAERVARVDEAIQALVNGDPDAGSSALSSELVTVYDSSIATNGTITNKAWIKWLRKNWQKWNITHVICDLDTFLAVEGRAGRPVVVGDAGNDIRLTSVPQMSLPGLPGTVTFFPVDSSLLGTNIMVGLDKSKAFRKVTYVGGSYTAVEQFVLRRSTAYRFDFAEAYFRLFDNGNGWQKLSLTTA
jgi:hypothetical protein